MPGSPPPTEPFFLSDPPHSAPNRTDSPNLPVLRGRVPHVAAHAQCRLVEVHGAKVASFGSDGSELLCLPQVFRLFLTQLVGGLHTVHSKLKRLRITPQVCSVEQVRVLRGLGAIQPGVNRCKLIRRTDFDTLYRDCTSTSSRPGRPPKRTLGVANMSDSSRLLPHDLLSPTLISQTGLAAAMTEALEMHKMRMMMRFHGNSDQQQQHSGAESENDDAGGSEGSWEKKQNLLSPPSLVVAPPAGSLHLSTLQQHGSLLANRLSDLPFMVMPHPLLPLGLPPASVAMAMNRMGQLGSLANMVGGPLSEDNKESPHRSPSPTDDEFHLQEPTSQSPSSYSSSPPPAPHTPELDGAEPEQREAPEPDGRLLQLPLLTSTNEKVPLSTNQRKDSFNPLLLAEGLSSMETLLTNVQGLLKVAVDSARSQSKQNQLERTELKQELDRERDIRQTLQRQLSSELQTQVSMQRRLKKEKRAKRRLQEALDFEWRRREQVDSPRLVYRSSDS